jgi:hypothetical protein
MIIGRGIDSLGEDKRPQFGKGADASRHFS